MDDFCIVFCDDEYILTVETENSIKASFKDIKRGLKLFTYKNGEKLVNDIKGGIAGIIDILFLDIEMPGMSGIEVKNILVNDPRVRRIVFLTGHTELTFPAFGLKVVSFLKKPVSDTELINIILPIEKELRVESTISYRSGKREYTFNLKELIYISTGNKGTILHFINKEDNKTTDTKINEWENIFKDECVIRVHKSYMVNLYFVEEIKNSTIYLCETNTEIPVGRVFTRKTRKMLDDFQRKIVEKRML